MKTLLLLITLLLSVSCFAQNSDSKITTSLPGLKKIRDTIKIELKDAIVNKLEAIQSARKELDDPNYIQKQKSILESLQAVLIETAVTQDGRVTKAIESLEYKNKALLVVQKKE